MLKINILSIGLLLSHMLIGQASFELEYNKPGDEFFRYTSETSTGDYILIGDQSEYSYSVPKSQLILKLNSSGEIINEVIYTKPDTNFFFIYGYEKANGNYFLMGILTDSLTSNDYNITYVCERTPELNLVWEKLYAIPEPYIHHNIDNFIIDADSMLIIQASADSSLEWTDNVLITMKFDKNGRLMTPSLGEYRIPTALDMPNVKTIIIESGEPNGPYGAKEVGEGAIMPTIPAILNAVYDATGCVLQNCR